MKAYFERVDAIEERLRQERMDYEARPSLVVRWYRWGIGMELCAPLEVRGVEGVRALAELAGRLIRRQTTLEAAHSGEPAIVGCTTLKLKQVQLAKK